MMKETANQRNPWIDILKAFAIYLVIVGHTLSNCIQNGGANKINSIIYFVHIPLFLVISGGLVKDKTMCKRFWLGLVKRFVIPYTVWTIILTTFYLGFEHLLHDGIEANVYVYLNNWSHSFLWFVKAYLVTYILWQALQYFKHPCSRLLVGSIILVLINLIVQGNMPLAEISSLSLYSYTLFGAGTWVKKFINKISIYSIVMLIICFLSCLPFATSQNNYFECSFSHMLQYGDWYIFIIRLVAGVCISIALIWVGRKKQLGCFAYNHIIQSVGRRTLQIYMLQSLLVEAALNRVIRLNNDFMGIATSFAVAIVMTLLCYIIIEITMKINLCRTLLWGAK
ncbi:acyltransferase [Segatella hominis]|uniref:Acyltransferase n=2 Tax=Segatella hominis TaxID=2518605 RepID=A0A4Y8USB1_9BACT|nr:acyltransferase [Segatella hominis]